MGYSLDQILNAKKKMNQLADDGISDKNDLKELIGYSSLLSETSQTGGNLYNVLLNQKQQAQDTLTKIEDQEKKAKKMGVFSGIGSLALGIIGSIATMGVGGVLTSSLLASGVGAGSTLGGKMIGNIAVGDNVFKFNNNDFKNALTSGVTAGVGQAVSSSISSLNEVNKLKDTTSSFAKTLIDNPIKTKIGASFLSNIGLQALDGNLNGTDILKTGLQSLANTGIESLGIDKALGLNNNNNFNFSATKLATSFSNTLINNNGKVGLLDVLNNLGRSISYNRDGGSGNKYGNVNNNNINTNNNVNPNISNDVGVNGGGEDTNKFNYNKNFNTNNTNENNNYNYNMSFDTTNNNENIFNIDTNFNTDNLNNVNKTDEQKRQDLLSSLSNMDLSSKMNFNTEYVDPNTLNTPESYNLYDVLNYYKPQQLEQEDINMPVVERIQQQQIQQQQMTSTQKKYSLNALGRYNWSLNYNTPLIGLPSGGII